MIECLSEYLQTIPDIFWADEYSALELVDDATMRIHTHACSCIGDSAEETLAIVQALKNIELTAMLVPASRGVANKIIGVYLITNQAHILDMLDDALYAYINRE